jgi:hypothetical protein
MVAVADQAVDFAQIGLVGDNHLRKLAYEARAVDI